MSRYLNSPWFQAGLAAGRNDQLGRGLGLSLSLGSGGVDYYNVGLRLRENERDRERLDERRRQDRMLQLYLRQQDRGDTLAKEERDRAFQREQAETSFNRQKDLIEDRTAGGIERDAARPVRPTKPPAPPSASQQAVAEEQRRQHQEEDLARYQAEGMGTDEDAEAAVRYAPSQRREKAMADAQKRVTDAMNRGRQAALAGRRDDRAQQRHDERIPPAARAQTAVDQTIAKARSIDEGRVLGLYRDLKRANDFASRPKSDAELMEDAKKAFEKATGRPAPVGARPAPQAPQPAGPSTNAAPDAAAVESAMSFIRATNNLTDLQAIEAALPTLPGIAPADAEVIRRAIEARKIELGGSGGAGGMGNPNGGPGPDMQAAVGGAGMEVGPPFVDDLGAPPAAPAPNVRYILDPLSGEYRDLLNQPAPQPTPVIGTPPTEEFWQNRMRGRAWRDPLAAGGAGGAGGAGPGAMGGQGAALPIDEPAGGVPVTDAEIQDAMRRNVPFAASGRRAVFDPRAEREPYIEMDGQRVTATDLARRMLERKSPEEIKKALDDMRARPDEYRRRGIDVDALLAPVDDHEEAA